MKNRILICCLVILLALTACSQSESEQHPIQQPSETVAVPDSAPEQEPEPEPEPLPDEEPVFIETEIVEEVLPEMIPGEPVTVDGMLLPGGSVRIDGTVCVRLQEVGEALKAELTLSDGQILLDGMAVETDLAAVEVQGDVWMPVELLQTMGLGWFYDEANAHHYYTTGAARFELPEGYRVPVLMYHAVSDDTWGIRELFVSPADMEAQLQYLQENGFTTIHFSDLARIDQIEKPVLLTFDDGYLDNYTELFPLLQKYNAKATIFAITKSIGVHHLYFTWEQAREMADSGLVEIHSHTVGHPNLDELTYEEQQYELEQSKLDILRNLGRESYVLCYPTGRYNADTLDLADDYYNFALKMNGNDYYTDERVYEINRWYVYRGMGLATFADMVE